MDAVGDTITFDGLGLRLDTAADSEIVCQKMVGKDVRVLILQGNTFGIEAAERVGQELSRQPNLKAAHFKDIFTSRGREEVPAAMSHLLKGISDSGAELKLLDLSDNAIGPIGAPSVIEFLATPSAEQIEKLYLNNCGLGPEGSSSIAPLISRLKNLREFVCGRNRLENKGAASMSRSLAELNTLELLRLPQNGIHVKGIKSLVGALYANIETIKDIDLSDNTIKAEGADALDKAISSAKNLEVLKLDDALLKNSGFSIICDALSKSQALRIMKEASFEGNELRGQKIVDLIDLTFKDCQQDLILNLLANEFNKSELQQLESMRERIEIVVDDPSDCEMYSDEEDETDEERSEDDDDDISDDNSNDNERTKNEISNDTTVKSIPSPNNGADIKQALINSFDQLDI